jgi:hypothetical protein
MTERHIYEGSGDATILTLNDFLQPIEPGEILEYTPFELVTRYTFTSFIVRSFAESRGRLAFQSIFCQLTENHSGFQVRNTLDGLLRSSARVAELLTPEEQMMLFKSYDGFANVPTHRVKVAQHLFPDIRTIHKKYDQYQFNTTLNTQLKSLCKYIDEREYAFAFNADMSYKDFAQRRDAMTLLSK